MAGRDDKDRKWDVKTNKYICCWFKGIVDSSNTDLNPIDI